MSSPLDRIEAAAGSYRAHWIRVQGSDEEVHLAAGSFLVRDVLALVNVARAAEELCAEPTHSGPADDQAVRVISCRSIREHFREALAALNNQQP